MSLPSLATLPPFGTQKHVRNLADIHKFLFHEESKSATNIATPSTAAAELERNLTLTPFLFVIFTGIFLVLLENAQPCLPHAWGATAHITFHIIFIAIGFIDLVTAEVPDLWDPEVGPQMSASAALASWLCLICTLSFPLLPLPLRSVEQKQEKNMIHRVSPYNYGPPLFSLPFPLLLYPSPAYQVQARWRWERRFKT